MADDQTIAVMKLLKELLQREGWRPGKVASRLNVTERTVARWWSGVGITIDILAEMCALINLTVIDLFIIAAASVKDAATHLTLTQEQKLAADPLAAFLFTHFLHGMSSDDVRRTFEIPEADLVLSLVKLEKIGVIKLLPRNHVRLNVPRGIKWRHDGPLALMRRRMLARLIGKIDFMKPERLEEANVVRLSAKSMALVDDKLKNLMREILHMAESDRRAKNDVLGDWYVLLLTAHKLDVSPYVLLGR